MNTGKIAVLLLPALIGLPFTVSAKDDMRALIKAMSAQMAELSNQVKHSNQRIAELEAKLAQTQQEKPAAQEKPPVPAVPAIQPATAQTANLPTTAVKPPESGQENIKTAPAVTVGDAKGTFKIPGTDTSLGFGGYVKLDANYSTIGMGGDKFGDQVLVMSQIPVGNDRRGEYSKTTFHAKESRFWLKSFTPSSWGDINTFLELDFLGAPQLYTYTPRLRHAYGSIGNLLAGQTWTTFLNVASIADTLDSVGSAGALMYLRQPLVRWTQPLNGTGMPLEFQAALESPSTRITASPSLAVSLDPYNFYYPNNDRYPDMVARLNFNPDWGSLSFAAMARQIRYSTQGASQTQGRWGSAFSLAGKIDMPGLDNIRFMLNYGNALGRYTTLNTFEDAALAANGQLQLVTAYSGDLAYQHWWNKAWRSSLVYGYAASDQPAFINAATTTRRTQSVNANLLWSPTSQVTLGVEYTYALRERIDGLTGDLHRIQFSSRFNF